MKFDFVIGNPPYQDETLGDNKGYAPPVYNLFLDEACKICDFVEMIHPARFLFNAGSTPKKWNEKILADKHFKVAFYENDSAKIFANTSIPGGIAITIQDSIHCFEPIGIFTPYPELNSILEKIKTSSSFDSMSSRVLSRTAYRLTAKMHADHPEALGQLSKGHAYDMSTNIFELLPQIFFEEKPQDGNEYICIYGRKDNERCYKFIRRDYVNDVCNLDKYKILFSKADGASGQIGNPIPARIIGKSEIASPMVGATESFICVGLFDTEKEANAAKKYIETKFVRVLLGILKTTQDITPDKWAFVPYQDFSSKSDINWSKSLSEIEEQLYSKYNFDSSEIHFINTYIKEMA